MTTPSKTNVYQEHLMTGNRSDLDEILPEIYQELRRLAGGYLRRERSDHTLQPTALVHEVYLRLVNQHSVDWRNRTHFFAIAAEMMRRILVNHAMQHQAAKRGGIHATISLDDATSVAANTEVDVVMLDTALQKLFELDQSQARIVELKFFGGLSIEEIAEVMEISESTVKREWRSAKAWLHSQLNPSHDSFVF